MENYIILSSIFAILVLFAGLMEIRYKNKQIKRLENIVDNLRFSTQVLVNRYRGSESAVEKLSRRLKNAAIDAECVSTALEVNGLKMNKENSTSYILTKIKDEKKNKSKAKDSSYRTKKRGKVSGK